jgi:hypothetical protein
MNNHVADFVRRLASMSPVLTDVYRQHLADQGDLLPHVLMGDITRAAIAGANDRKANWLPTLLEQLEAGLASGDDDIVELIGVSFVENLSGESSAIRALIPSMGEALRKEVRSICGV